MEKQLKDKYDAHKNRITQIIKRQEEFSRVMPTESPDQKKVVLAQQSELKQNPFVTN